LSGLDVVPERTGHETPLPMKMFGLFSRRLSEPAVLLASVEDVDVSPARHQAQPSQDQPAASTLPEQSSSHTESNSPDAKTPLARLPEKEGPSPKGWEGAGSPPDTNNSHRNPMTESGSEIHENESHEAKETKPEVTHSDQSDGAKIEMPNQGAPLAEPVLYQGRVFRSSDEKLYLAGGSNGAASLYTEAGFRRNIDSAAWSTLLADRREAVTKTGSAFAQLIVPEKMTVYPLNDADRQLVFPGSAPEDIVPPGRRLLQKIGPKGIFYPDDFLRVQAEGLAIYMPTDSHWTWLGAFSAFQALMWELNYAPIYDAFVHLPRRRLLYKGDLWEASFPSIEADKFERLVLPASVRRVYANSILGLKEAKNLNDEPGLHGGSHCIFVNCAAEIKQTVVVFGSSFSECRLDPSLLTAIFSYFFETVHFVWTTAVDVEYVVRHKAHLTIAEIPERFLTICPDDSTRVEENALSRVQAWRGRAIA
jgi:hypothetical protein